jgi:histone-lysine N-methyltransferase SUV39H
MRFLVKWDGHPPSANTYEPFEHIQHCEVLQEYVDRKFIQHSDQIEKIRKELLSDIQEKFDSYKNRSKQSIVKKFCDFSELEFKCSLLAYIFTYGGEVLTPFMKKLRYGNLIYHFYAQWKKEQDSNFILLETIMSEENYTFELTAENNIDYDPIPKFNYIAKVKYPITSFNFKLNAGCKCGSTCNSYTNCCPQNLGWNFVYNEIDLKLNTKEIQMIVECNDFCNCDKNCPNRPKEITVKLVIFKTINRGWSVKTLDHIPAGKFIVEYTGEFLDQNESKKRARKYGKINHTYLFDLDYIDKGTPYSIDATHEGNIARFINHSCNPNLSTWPATTCNQDPRMHKLYYFSQRYIRPGEEL